jgi:hypothetical protein
MRLLTKSILFFIYASLNNAYASYVGISNNWLHINYQEDSMSELDNYNEQHPYHVTELEDFGFHIGKDLSEGFDLEFSYFRGEKYKYTTDLKTGVGLGFVSVDIIYSKPVTFSDQLELGYLVGVSHVKAKVGEVYSNGGNVTAYHVHTNKSLAINLGIKASYNVNPNYGYNLYLKYMNLHDLAFPGLKNVNRIHSINMLTISVFFNF